MHLCICFYQCVQCNINLIQYITVEFQDKCFLDNYFRFHAKLVYATTMILDDSAIPTALARPCPKGPVVTSTPNPKLISGCPGVQEPSCLNFLRLVLFYVF